MPTLHEFLQPQFILKVVSRVKRHQSRFSKWMGFQPKKFDADTVQLSGPNTRPGRGRTGSYRIMDATRSVATFKSPDSPPAVKPHNPLGVVNYTYARAHEKLVMSYESLGNQATIMGPSSVLDPLGENYVMKQATHLAQKFNNAISALAAGVMRTALYLVQDGDDWNVKFSAPSAGTPYVLIDYQVPAGNKTTLDMLGAGAIVGTTWANTSAPIVLNLAKMRAAYTLLTGYQLEHIWCTSPMWYNLLVNTEVRNTAGSSSTPYATYERVNETDTDGDPVSEHGAILKADPNITWHISDEALVLGGTDPSYAAGSGTVTSLIGDTNIFGCPTPSNEWVEMSYGSEPVVEYSGGNVGVDRSGYYFWHKYIDQPAGVELIGLLNALGLLYVPKAEIFATPVF